MEIEFIRAIAGRIKPKATIHQSGKLGLNIEASSLMEVDKKKSFLIGKDKGDENKLYLFESEDEGAVKVSKAGDYYYLNAAGVFDMLNMNYKEYSIMFDIYKDRYNERDIYVLTKRTPKERKAK